MECMIDIETFATTPNSAIATIGAIKFNRNDSIIGAHKIDTFYVKIKRDSCTRLGMYVDPETVKWWLKQSEDAKREIFGDEDRTDIKEALLMLSEFVKGHNNIWANSPNFDCVILENAFRKCGMSEPWKFWNLRDCRTVYDLAQTNLKTFSKSGTAHNALNDCYFQILCLQKSFEKLKVIQL